MTHRNINLSNFECLPTHKEYNKLYTKFRKLIVSSKIKKSKQLICRVFMGPPGSGKSTHADKCEINIDVDRIIDLLYESETLLKAGVKHGNVIESCANVGVRIADDIISYCMKKKYSFAMHSLYGLPVNFLHELKMQKYIIVSSYVYSYDSYTNNIERPGLNLSKRSYLSVIKSMKNVKDLFTTFECSDSFEFIQTTRGKQKKVIVNSKQWHLASTKIMSILDKLVDIVYKA